MADDELRIRAGTSGWHHRHWRGAFYPPKLRARDWLAHYAAEFDCVEVDGSFYALPEPDVLDRWHDATPDDFRFAVKAPRVITHQKKLKNCETEIQRLLARLDRLGDKLGPILFQLPARWRVNVRRLEAFLDALPHGRRYAFELRDPSWHGTEVLDAMRAHGASFCIFDADGRTTAAELTGPFVYVRLHGPAGARTRSYRPERLRRWAGDALGWARRGLDVVVILDNDERAWAVKNARRLRACLAEGPAHPGVVADAIG